MNKLIAIAVLWSGCLSQPLAGIAPVVDGSAPLVPPVAGVYDVTIAAAVGDCAPATVSGPLAPLQQAIDVADGGALRVQMPDVTIGKSALFATRDLPGYHWQQSLSRCGAEVAYDVDALVVAADELTLARSELWTNTVSAHGNGDGGSVDDASCDYVPPRDCGSSVTIRYKLAEPCAAPCHVGIADGAAPNGFPAVRCVCSD